MKHWIVGVVSIVLCSNALSQDFSISATFLSNPLGAQVGVRLEGRYGRYLSDNLETGARLRLESNPLGGRFRVRLTPFINYSQWLYRSSNLELSGFIGLETPLSYTTPSSSELTFGLLTFAGLSSGYAIVSNLDLQTSLTADIELLPAVAFFITPQAQLVYTQDALQLYIGGNITLLRSPTSFDVWVGTDYELDASSDLRFRIGYDGNPYVLLRYRIRF